MTIKKAAIFFLFSFLILAGGCAMVGNSVEKADQWIRDNLWQRG